MMKKQSAVKRPVAKMMGVSPWRDNAREIATMVKTEERSASEILRELIDEALQARRNKELGLSFAAPSEQTEVVIKEMETLQNALFHLIEQSNEICRRLEVSFALQQETFAESFGASSLLWESIVESRVEEPDRMEGTGVNSLDERRAAWKEHAYRTAEQLMNLSTDEEAMRLEDDKSNGVTSSEFDENAD